MAVRIASESSGGSRFFKRKLSTLLIRALASDGHGATVVAFGRSDEKLAIAGRYPGVSTVNIKKEKLVDAVNAATDGWGVDVLFEASGSPRAYDDIPQIICPGGCLVAIGMPVEPLEVSPPIVTVAELTDPQA